MLKRIFAATTLAFSAFAVQAQTFPLDKPIVPGNPAHDLSPTAADCLQVRVHVHPGHLRARRLSGHPAGQERRLGFRAEHPVPVVAHNVGAGWYYLDAFWPVSQNETVYELAYYFPKPKSAAEMISQEFSKIVLRDLSREDLYTNEVTQRALNSGAIKNITLSDQEAAVRHLYRTVERLVGR